MVNSESYTDITHVHLNEKKSKTQMSILIFIKRLLPERPHFAEERSRFSQPTNL